MWSTLKATKEILMNELYFCVYLKIRATFYRMYIQSFANLSHWCSKNKIKLELHYQTAVRNDDFFSNTDYIQIGPLHLWMICLFLKLFKLCSQYVHVKRNIMLGFRSLFDAKCSKTILNTWLLAIFQNPAWSSAWIEIFRSSPYKSFLGPTQKKIVDPSPAPPVVNAKSSVRARSGQFITFCGPANQSEFSVKYWRLS